MCYIIYLSTDSPDDLSVYNGTLMTLSRVKNDSGDPAVSKLSHPHIWYVGSRHYCSCGFRHNPNIEFGFTEPVKWYEEDPQDIEATKKLYRLYKDQLAKGYKIDCINRWEGTDTNEIRDMDVSLDEVDESQFLLFENYYLTFR